ncbi:Mur ligase family protein [Candidatus Gottesmanbacteria bacterium]|nr:Mur ligase family protein [Candidatus Gottesmanbacteria bacterium]
MHLLNLLIVWAGKSASRISRIFRIGSGATWPGEIALRLRPDILSLLFSQLRKGVIIIAGTNGKTTTALMVKKIAEAQGMSVIHNDSGANLDNGIISAFIKHASWGGTIRADWGVFEVDENILPQIVAQLKTQNSRLKTTTKNVKLIIVLLNLFRDQLDRYGEVDVIAEKWEKALRLRSGQALEHKNTTLILNADDPLVAHLGVASKLPVTYFGVNDKTQYLSKMEHATDSIFCLNCGGRLSYEGIYYSHIGIWYCTTCKEKRPIPDVSDWKSPLPGLYNQYNTLAAVIVAKALHIKDKDIEASLTTFRPAFGRQEEFTVNGKTIKIFLSKNPAGFNQSLKTVLALGATQLLFVLNDRIPDGRDVSWIWDVDFELLKEDKRVIEEPFGYAQGRHDEHVKKKYKKGEKIGRYTMRISVSGERCYDLAVRLKYADIPLQESQVFENLEKAVRQSLEQEHTGETLYILPTYSAMLETRKILTGKKIL